MKRILISVLLAAFGVGAVVFYYWQQATQLPSWYTTDQSVDMEPAESGERLAAIDSNQPTPDENRTPDKGSATPSTNSATVKKAENKSQPSQKSIASPKPVNVPQKTPDGKVKVQLNEKELNHLFSSEIKRKAQNNKLAKAVKGVNTTIQNGQVESGAVINLSELSPHQLSEGGEAFLAKLVSVFPDLSNRSVYVGLEGKPTVKNGQVVLDDNTRIKLGNLSFTPAELSQRLGIPEEQIREHINLQLQLGGIHINDVELVDDRAVVQGAEN